MARGGVRPGAGRPKTVPATDAAAWSEARSVALAENLTPLAYMLKVMNDPGNDPARRDRMAQAAAPYVHPRAEAGGKKAVAAEEARVAGAGTDWGDDLQMNIRAN